MKRWTWILAALTSLVWGCDPEAEGPAATDWEVDGAPSQWWLSVVHSGNERYVVGGSPAKGVMLHDPGTGALAEVETGHEVGLLNWIHRFDDGSLVTVGAEGAVLYSTDGLTWANHSVETAQQLWGVWGSSPGDVWAVGGLGQKEGDAVIFHGSVDKLEPVEFTLDRPNVNAWFKVWGSGAQDVHIIGQKGAILHWDGTALTEGGAGLSEDLIGIWGTGPDRVVAVGGRNNGVVAFYDGKNWTGKELAPVTGLNGVWFRGNTVHAVGVDDAKVIRMAFGSGELLEEEDFLGTRLEEAEGIELHAIHGSSSGKVTAVGGNFILIGGPYEGAVVQRQLGGDE